jgi:ribosomal protein S18 acetylase RimI-like enzyme
MGVVSVEKTAPGVAGAPQFIYSEFCRTMFEDVSEINAGDDWGIATLRFTKESYRPTRMLSKWSISREAQAEPKLPERSVVRTLTYRRRNSTVLEPAVPARATVRRATLTDSKAIIGIETKAFDQPKEAFTMSQIRRLISNPRARVGIVEVDGLVAGWCVSLIRSHLRSRSGRVYSVAVLPEHAGKGLGRALIEWSLNTLESENIQRIYLEVRASNIAALGLYQSVGFTPIRTLVDYYGKGTDGIRMRRIAPNNTPAK